MLNNIFRKTKRKQKTINPPKIVVDIREKNSLVIPYLHELKAEIDIRHLRVGDYLIGNIAIERKTFSDFLGSMINKRLIQQLGHLLQYKQPLLIIEGYDLDRLEQRNISPNAVRGFILSITLNYNIPVLFTEDSQETALYLLTLAKQQSKPKQEISLHARIPKTKKEQQKYILESFPNIGPKTAEKLLKKFKTVREIINASEQELIELIGKKADSLISLRDINF